MVAREGQHSGVVTNPFRKVVPPAPKMRRVFGITPRVPARWSSVRTIRTLGRAGWAEEDAEGDAVDPVGALPLWLPTVAVSATPFVHAAARATRARIAAERRRFTPTTPGTPPTPRRPRPHPSPAAGSVPQRPRRGRTQRSP